MKDMLVRLTDLPDVSELEKKLSADDIVFRKPIPPEKHLLVEWAETHFSNYWSSEIDVALSGNNPTCYVAQQHGKPIGFACYETTAKNFFGPTGVLESHRGLGVGKVLLIKALAGMKSMGYAYAIIGGVGPVEYYQNAVKAVLIDGSEKSIYTHLLRYE